MPNNTPSQEVAANVRAEVARRRITQTVLAEKLQLTQSGVSRRLLGYVAFSVDDLAVLSELFQVPLSRLLGDGAAAPASSAAAS